jgi:hypothetical protein
MSDSQLKFLTLMSVLCQDARTCGTAKEERDTWRQDIDIEMAVNDVSIGEQVRAAELVHLGCPDRPILTERHKLKRKQRTEVSFLSSVLFRCFMHWGTS